jgi:glyoxylase-like metal-dependent hydrolase (beta-lactamase superfamily II)
MMRKITSDVYIENKFPAVCLGLIRIDGKTLLIDCPIRLEDSRVWLMESLEYGESVYTVILDHHPDRIVGARDLQMPLVGHSMTSQIMATKSDSFKGSAHPIGAETDRLKRVTGISRSIPNLTFSDKMTIRLGRGEVEVWHRPGPMDGSIWVVFHKQEVIFIGDAVTVEEPPFVGEANIPAWLETLDELRSADLRSYRLLSSRDGEIDRDKINSMARLLRKVQLRVDRIEKTGDSGAGFDKIAAELLSNFTLSGSRRDRAHLRLRVGVEDLYQKLYRTEAE